MMNPLTNALIFLTDTATTLYILAILLRFILQIVKADFYNPVCQMLMKLTNPLLLPLRRIIPGFFGLDFAALILMLFLEIVSLAIIAAIRLQVPSVFMAFTAIIKLLLLTTNVYCFSLIIRAISSWFASHNTNPIIVIVYRITEPLLRPVRRYIPGIHGFDFSPIIVFVLLQAVAIFLRYAAI
ncbi:MAG: YggT family protein [Legionellales bacterium]|nr:MAG: YggT family protein [Legionellales bacterium]